MLRKDINGKKKEEEPFFFFSVGVLVVLAYREALARIAVQFPHFCGVHQQKLALPS